MHIAIVGGGIGGLTMALALARRGIEADVYEAAPALRPVGAGIWVPPNALSVLARLGVAEAIRRAGVQLERAEVRDEEAGLLQGVDMRDFAARFGFPNVAITRSALHRVLIEAIDGARLHLGRRCDRVTPADGGATIHWESGDHTEVELVIGADGLQSSTRRAVAPNATLRYSGQSCHRGIARCELPPELRTTAWEVWGGAIRFGFSAIGPGEVYWFAPFLAAAGEADESANLAARLTERYRTFPAPIPHIIRATPDEDILRTDLYDLRPLVRWSARGVVLVGDAAHATTPNLGQGGAQAIEDALVLADAIAAHGPTTTACTEYERKRRTRAHGVVTMSRRLGRVAHLRSGWLRGVRNGLIRAAPAAVSDRALRKLLASPY